MPYYVINRNMRCIEMIVSYISRQEMESINRNMRCIEICLGARPPGGQR